MVVSEAMSLHRIETLTSHQNLRIILQMRNTKIKERPKALSKIGLEVH